MCDQRGRWWYLLVAFILWSIFSTIYVFPDQAPSPTDTGRHLLGCLKLQVCTSRVARFVKKKLVYESFVKMRAKRPFVSIRDSFQKGGGNNRIYISRPCTVMLNNYYWCIPCQGFLGPNLELLADGESYSTCRSHWPHRANRELSKPVHTYEIVGGIHFYSAIMIVFTLELWPLAAAQHAEGRVPTIHD